MSGGEQTLQQACYQECPGSARCVQSFDDSLDSAIRITYRISLRSSSMWEPRHPSLKVVLISVVSAAQVIIIFKKMMTTLNSRLLVSQSRSGGRFQVGFGVCCAGARPTNNEVVQGSYQTFWLVSFHGCVVAPGRAQICIRTAEPRKQLLVGV